MLSSILKTLGLIGPTISLFDLGRTAPCTKRASSLNYRFTDRTTDARHWHNPADPVQAARIEAAAAKRERKGARLAYCACQSLHFNKAHLGLADGVRRANPFHVAH